MLIFQKENVDFNNLIDINLPYQRDKYGIRIGEVMSNITLYLFKISIYIEYYNKNLVTLINN